MKPWRRKLHEVIFEADTVAGRWFDTLLIVSILVSVGIVMLDSVAAINQHYGRWFFWWEWGFTLLFTCEYLLRLICLEPRRLRLVRVSPHRPEPTTDYALSALLPPRGLPRDVKGI